MRCAELTETSAALAIMAPVQCVASLGGSCSARADDAFGHVLPQPRDAGGPGFVAQKAVETFLHEALLPAPDAGVGLAGPAHDLVRDDAVGGEQDDLGPPRVLLRGVAVSDDRLKPPSIGSRNSDGNPRAHASDSHTHETTGIPQGTRTSDFIH